MREIHSFHRTIIHIGRFGNELGYFFPDCHPTSSSIQDRQGNLLIKHVFYFWPTITAVIPAQAGIRKNWPERLDSRLRGNDAKELAEG